MHSNYNLYVIAVGVIFLSIFFYDTSNYYLLICIIVVVTWLIYCALGANSKRRQAELVLSLNKAYTQTRFRRRNLLNSSQEKSPINFSPKFKSNGNSFNPWGVTGNPTFVKPKALVRIAPAIGAETQVSTSTHHDKLSSYEHKIGFANEVLSSCQNLSSYHPHYNLGSFPTINLNKSPLPSLSARNSFMVHSPITVKIAPPDKFGYTRPRSDVSCAESIRNTSSVNSVVTALQSCRKRPKTAIDDIENQVKRQRHDSSSSTGSAFTSLNSKPEGVFNGILQTSTEFSPLYPMKDGPALSSQKRGFVDNDHIKLKKFKNNEIYSSYSSSKNFLKQKRRRRLQLATPAKKISLSTSTPNTSINQNDKENETFAREVNHQMQVSSTSKDMVVVSKENKSQENITSPMVISEELSKKRNLPLYNSFHEITSPKSLYISECNTTIDDIQKDQQASHARLQKIISNINNVFDAKDKKIRQSASTSDLSKANLSEIQVTPNILPKVSSSLSSELTIETSVITTPTFTTTVSSTSSATIMTTSTFTVTSAFSNNTSLGNLASSVFLQSNEVSKSSPANVTTTPSSVFGKIVSSPSTITNLTPKNITATSPVVLNGGKQPVISSAPLFEANNTSTKSSAINLLHQNGHQENPSLCKNESNQPSSAPSFTMSSNSIFPVTSVITCNSSQIVTTSASGLLNSNSSQSFLPNFSENSSKLTPVSLPHSFLPFQSVTPNNGSGQVSHNFNNASNTHLPNATFQAEEKNKFPCNIINTAKTNISSANTETKLDSSKANSSVTFNFETVNSPKLNPVVNTLESSTTTMLNNSFFPNFGNNNNNKTNTFLTPQTSHSMNVNQPLTTGILNTPNSLNSAATATSNELQNSKIPSFQMSFLKNNGNCEPETNKTNQVSSSVFQFGTPNIKSAGFNFGFTNTKPNALNNSSENKEFAFQGIVNQPQNSFNTNSTFNFANSSGPFSKENSSPASIVNTNNSSPFMFGGSSTADFKFNSFAKSESASSSVSNRRSLQARRRAQQRH